jgi:hypothetical protein
LEALDIRHVYIRPRTPRFNGKVERSHRVDDQEFYQLLDRDGIRDDIHLFNEKLREWEDYYNYHRPHGALGNQTPYERLLAKTRAEVLPGPTGQNWSGRVDLNHRPSVPKRPGIAGPERLARVFSRHASVWSGPVGRLLVGLSRKPFSKFLKLAGQWARWPFSRTYLTSA